MKNAENDELMQRLFELRKVGKTFQEIADEVGMSRPTVTKHLKGYLGEIEAQKAAERLARIKSSGYSKDDRAIEALDQLKRIDEVLKGRDLVDLPTPLILSEKAKILKDVEKWEKEDQKTLFGGFHSEEDLVSCAVSGDQEGVDSKNTVPAKRGGGKFPSTGRRIGE